MPYETDITVVLDRSGSMSSIRGDTIGGFNAFLKDQQGESGAARLTLVQFDNQYEVVHDNLPLAEVPELTETTFVPRASTALLDALGRTINSTGARLASLPEADRPKNVIFVVITDGLENASTEFTREKVFEMVSHQTEKYAWDFVYLGANQDAIAVGQSLGVRAGSSLSYTASAVGTSNTYDNASLHVKELRRGNKTRSFTAAERDASLES